ncbi:MAG: hypothetical protein P9M08_06720 [Candidatus Erginobacter occultus]|nr:hypothetical protein [Candidatus Erginobacter occultus]
MNQENPPPGGIDWIPLKDAARMLGCSVKTIRRRIKGGTWRSMIEYQGQKAIRLVAREDVLKESTALDRLPADSPESALALQALDGLPRQLGEVLQSYLAGLKAELDRKTLYSRIYLLATVGLAVILLTGAGLYYGRQRGELLERRIEVLSRTLSTTLAQGQTRLGGEIGKISTLAEENRRLGESAQAGAERRDRTLETLRASLEKLEGAGEQALREAEETRRELAGLRRELAGWKELPGREENLPEDSPEISSPPRAEDNPESSPPAPEPEPEREEKSSRFLGIF